MISEEGVLGIALATIAGMWATLRQLWTRRTQEYENQIEELKTAHKAETEKLTASVDAMKLFTETLQTQMESLHTQLALAQAKLITHQNALDQIGLMKTRIDGLQTELKELRASYQSLKKQTDDQRDLLKQKDQRIAELTEQMIEAKRENSVLIAQETAYEKALTWLGIQLEEKQENSKATKKIGE